jgi:hypothetical protein
MVLRQELAKRGVGVYRPFASEIVSRQEKLERILALVFQATGKLNDSLTCSTSRTSYF